MGLSFLSKFLLSGYLNDNFFNGMTTINLGGHEFVNLVTTGRSGHYFTTDKEGRYGGVQIQMVKWFAEKLNFNIRYFVKF